MTNNTDIPLPKRVRNHVNPMADQTDICFDGFANNQPIIVDIGAYRGEFSQQLVGRFAEQYNYIVTEIRKPYAQYLTKLFAPHAHVAVFGGDSSRNIAGLLASAVGRGIYAEYIFINFPDPWFKEKHKKRRVLNTHFLDELQGLVNKTTHIIFQTDQEPLFRETMDVVEQHKQWDVRYFDAPLWDMQSHWEQMKIQEGDTVYRADITLRE